MKIKVGVEDSSLEKQDEFTKKVAVMRATIARCQTTKMQRECFQLDHRKVVNAKTSKFNQRCLGETMKVRVMST